MNIYGIIEFFSLLLLTLCFSLLIGVIAELPDLNHKLEKGKITQQEYNKHTYFSFGIVILSLFYMIIECIFTIGFNISIPFYFCELIGII